MNRPRLRLAATISIVGGLAPLLSLLVSEAAAKAANCIVDDSGARACLIHGVDVGQPLYALAYIAWFFLFTWPFVIVGVALWVWLRLRRS